MRPNRQSSVGDQISIEFCPLTQKLFFLSILIRKSLTNLATNVILLLALTSAKYIQFSYLPAACRSPLMSQ